MILFWIYKAKFFFSLSDWRSNRRSTTIRFKIKKLFRIKLRPLECFHKQLTASNIQLRSHFKVRRLTQRVTWNIIWWRWQMNVPVKIWWLDHLRSSLGNAAGSTFFTKWNHATLIGGEMQTLSRNSSPVA